MHVLTFLCQCLHKPASVKQNEDHPIDKKINLKKKQIMIHLQNTLSHNPIKSGLKSQSSVSTVSGINTYFCQASKFSCSHPKL